VIYLIAVLVVLALGFIAGTRLEVVEGQFMKTAVQAAATIALVRLGLYVLGLAFYRYADWRQALGYGLLTVNSVVELAIASTWTDPRRGPSLAAPVLIVVTSALLGFAWAWIRVRPVSR
jgi:hypothetical protein